MDPWEVVKWVAIFRLIIPGALFRLCGGRVENLGELVAVASLRLSAGIHTTEDELDLAIDAVAGIRPFFGLGEGAGA